MFNFQVLVSQIGGLASMSIIVGTISLVLLSLGHKKDSFRVMFSSILAISTTFVLKSIFKIPRPDDMLVNESGYRFPSGHATMAAVFSTLMIYYASKLIKNNFLKCFTYLVAAVWYILVSYSRLYLNVHLPIDVIVGGTIGVVSTIMVIYAVDHYIVKTN